MAGVKTFAEQADRALKGMLGTVERLNEEQRRGLSIGRSGGGFSGSVGAGGGGFSGRVGGGGSGGGAGLAQVVAQALIPELRSLLGQNGSMARLQGWLG